MCPIDLEMPEGVGGFAGGGGVPAVVCRELDAFASPTAWYVTDPTRATVDRSGNGNTLTQTDVPVQAAGPDLGMVALRSGRWTRNTSTFRVTGAISVVSLTDLNTFSGDNWIAAGERTGVSRPTYWKFGVQLNAGSRRFIAAWDTTGAGIFTPIGGVIPASGFHVLGFTRAANGVDLVAYLDGDPVATATASAPSNVATDSNLWIGQDAFGTPNTVINQVIAVKVGGWTATQHRNIARRLLGG